jgi:hypothetical protein
MGGAAADGVFGGELDDRWRIRPGYEWPFVAATHTAAACLDALDVLSRRIAGDGLESEQRGCRASAVHQGLRIHASHCWFTEPATQCRIRDGQ